MGSPIVYCLHGFLGKGSDWDPFNSLLRSDNLIKPDLFSGGDILSFEDWALRFNRGVGDSRPVLIGYSLGGRLALHAFFAQPELFRGVVLVSSHPGLQKEEDRLARLAADEKWARRFESSEEWENLMQDWNALPVFGGVSQALPRKESDFSRSALAQSLRRWSLGMQRDFRLDLASSPAASRVLWVAGSQDRKYADLAGEVALRVRVERVEGAGHRVPWEKPEPFSALVRDFIDSCYSTAIRFSKIK